MTDTIDIRIVDENDQINIITIPYCDPCDIESVLETKLLETRKKFSFTMLKKDETTYRIGYGPMVTLSNTIPIEPGISEREKNFYLINYPDFAPCEESESFVSALLEIGADPFFVSETKSVLSVAMNIEDISVVKILFEFAGPKLLFVKPALEPTPFVLCVKYPRIMEYFLTYIDKDIVTEEYNGTLLYEASLAGNIESVKILLDMGAKHVKKYKQQSPIWRAAADNRFDIVEEIAKVGYPGMWEDILKDYIAGTIRSRIPVEKRATENLRKILKEYGKIP